MPIQKRPLPDGRPVSEGFDCYECSECKAQSYNSVKMNHRLGCSENPDTAQLAASMRGHR